MSMFKVALTFLLCLILTYVLFALGPIGYMIGIAFFFTLLIYVAALLKGIHDRMK